MANVLAAFRTTTVASLSTINSAAQSITHAADSISALTETASAHARAYRDNSVEELRINGVARRQLRTQTASVQLARDLRALERELAADPELAQVYATIDSKLFDEKPKAVA